MAYCAFASFIYIVCVCAVLCSKLTTNIVLCPSTCVEILRIFINISVSQEFSICL